MKWKSVQRKRNQAAARLKNKLLFLIIAFKVFEKSNTFFLLCDKDYKPTFFYSSILHHKI